ncbi:conjugal transfer mating pair stabilization protein TraN [Piscirickettsia litoralis]|uniref:Conjugal transfer protein TraN n=1 Tax=Piscirickettsia litoralis TaxID=1891921 RepID=A0ABX3A137_9GAMM|nr:conjugal transfer mating pair stabilization protein TraN [Piscirickettsia litoralis]ODN41391.1 hypothetical protein BGC07_16620 [Piscirickettsia litoralis]
MFFEKRIKKIIASTLVVSMSVFSINSAFANFTLKGDNSDFEKTAKEAQDLGHQWGKQLGAQQQKSTNNNGEIVWGDQKNQMKINIKDLFPGTSHVSKEDMDYYFPDGKAPDVNAMQNAANSSSAMDELGKQAKTSLYGDSKSGHPSMMGQVYDVAEKTFSDKSRPDLSKDPMFQQQKNIFDNIDLIDAGFTDCKKDTEIIKIKEKKHLPDYKQCTQINDRSGSCVVNHTYSASIIEHYNGPFNYSPCGKGCMLLWIGRVGDNYWGGNCSIYQEETKVRVTNPDAITSATLEYAKWDDYMQVWVGKDGMENKVWNGPNDNFPPETPGACELSTSWERGLNVDVTDAFKKNVDPGEIVNFKVRVSVTGGGEGYARIRIHFDPKKVVQRDEWTPESCVDAAQGIYDGFAKGTVKCIQNPADKDGCTVMNGLKVCNPYFKTPPLKGIPPLCTKVQVDADYKQNSVDALKSIYAYDSCDQYKDKCGFINSKCVDGSKGKSGLCYMFTDTYDCGKDVEVENKKKKFVYKCPGAVECLGGECVDNTAGKSQDFAKAAALLHVAEFMTQDMKCVKPDATQDVTCKVFSGKAGSCHSGKAAQDCCEAPEGISLSDYITLIMAAPKLDTGIMSLGDTNIIKSAYSALRNPIVNSWTEAVKPFSNFVDNISGAYEKLTQPIEDFVKEIMKEFEDKLKQIFYDMFKKQATEAGAQAGASEASGTAAKSMATGAATWLATAMTIYQIYVITMLIYKQFIIGACTKDEYQMNAQRELKNCHYIGSYCGKKVPGLGCIKTIKAYCCYNSPLSRIIQEQVRPQLGMSFGAAEHPSCDGIPLNRLNEIDWSKVDLSEWQAILKVTGHYPKDASDLNIDKLTGKGSTLNINGDRKNAIERTKQRIDGLDIDKLRRKMTKNIIPDIGEPTQ